MSYLDDTVHVRKYTGVCMGYLQVLQLPDAIQSHACEGIWDVQVGHWCECEGEWLLVFLCSDKGDKLAAVQVRHGQTG